MNMAKTTTEIEVVMLKGIGKTKAADIASAKKTILGNMIALEKDAKASRRKRAALRLRRKRGLRRIYSITDVFARP